MSDVDKRVVQMDFDNKKFEKNVKQSTESLNTLKSSLNFDGVSNSIDQVTVKFSKMEVVVASVISNITNRIVNLGLQIVKSLSVDNIAAGWEKFGQKTTSVATLMAQTLKVNGEILEDAEKLTTVNELMDKLMWFTDETSYSFTDMIDNIGKFTAAGLDLDVSTKAMEGIANWAALSGQNASTASRAMYQLSQAMGKGKIQLIDWKSIQNANMDTAEMRENVLETAVAMGQLTKEGDKYVTKTGKKFTQNQFTEELSEGWFTSDVLTATLEKYSGATDEIYALAQKEGKTASEILEKYGDTLDSFGVKAFKAAQEARTLSDALNSVKDAVASKWMTTSELIFGDKDEAVELWTDLANALYEVFAESGDFRNAILEVWNALGGREDLFKRGGDDQGAFWNIFDAIIAVKNVIKQAWNTIFPLSQMEKDSDQAQEIGNAIKQLTSRFKEWTKTLKLSDVNALRLRKILEGLFTILKGVLTVLKAIKFIAEPIVDVIKKMAAAGIDALISLMGKFNISGEWLVIVSNKIHDGLEHMFEAVSDFVKEYVSIDKIKNAFAKLGAVFANLAPVLEKVKSSFVDFGTKIKSIATTAVNAVKQLFGVADGKTVDAKVVKPIKKSLSSFSKVATEVTETSEASEGSSRGLLSGLVELFKAFYEVLVSLLSLTTATVSLLAKILQVGSIIIQNLANGIKSIIDGTFKLEEWQKNLLIVVGIVGGIAAIVVLIFKMVYNMFYTVSAMISPLGVVADSLSGYLDKLATQTLSNAIKNFGIAILEIASAILIIASIDPSRLWPAVAVMGIISAVLAGLMALVWGVLKTTQTISTSTSLVVNETHTIKESIAGCFDEVKDTISESKKLLKVNALIRTMTAFGTAMMQVALAIYIIGQLDEKQIQMGAMVIGIATVAILALSSFAQECEKSVKDALPGLGQMIVMGALISSIGKVLLKFKGINEEQRKNILVASGVMVAFLAFCLFFMNAITKISQKGDIKDNGKTLNQLKGLAGSLLTFAIALRIVAKQPWEQILAAGAAIIAVMGSLVGAVAIMSKLNISGTDFLASTGSIALGMVGLSVALVLFAEAFSRLEKIDWPTIGKGAAVVAGGLALLVVAGLAAQKIVKPILAVSGAFLMIGLGMMLAATAIQMVISTLTTLSTMSEEQLATVSTTMNTFMSILGNSFGPLITGLINSLREALPAILALANEAVLGILNLLQTQLPEIATLAVNTIADITAKLADKSQEIFESISTLIDNLLEMLKTNADDWTQDVLDILIKILKKFSDSDNVSQIVTQFLTFFKNVIKSLVDNADLIDQIFSAAMDLAKLLIKKLTAAAIELAGMLGEVLLIVTAAAIRILIASLGALSKLFVTLVGSVLLILAYTVSGLTNVVLEVFKVIVKELLSAMVEAIIWAQDVLKAIGILVLKLIARGLLSAIETGFGWLFDTIDKIFGTNIKASLQQVQDDLANSARDTVAGLEASTDRVQNVLKNTASNINDVISMTATQANEAVQDGMNQIGSAVTDATDQLSKTFNTSGEEAGENLGDGLVNGTNSNSKKLYQAGQNAGQQVINGEKAITKTHSPSRVFYGLGAYIVQGLANGITDNTYVATDGMTTMVSEALTAAQNTLDSQNGDDLTIKVGMDISGVEEQSRNISSIMSGINNVNATAYGKNASYNSAAMNKGASAGTVNSTDNSTTVTYNNVINVSSTDPERSADEIDRALQRQATMAKLAHGAV
jgi:tape measure domain-containing protein